jgi:hypothetical protein
MYPNAIHLYGKKNGTVCGMPGRRWEACVVFSVKQPKTVTCKRCLKLMNGGKGNGRVAL